MVLIDILEESRKNKKLSTGILLKNIFADNWSKTFLFDSTADKSFSYKEFFTLVIKYSEKLQKLGLQKNDKVCLLLPNSVDLIALYFACLITRLVAVPIDPEKNTNEVNEILSYTNYKVIVNDDPTSLRTTNIEDFHNHILQNKVNINELEIFNTLNYDDLFLITFTSGTTGIPKGVMHSFNNLMLSASAFTKKFNFNENNIFYHNLPMSYIAGILNLIILPFISQSKIVLGKRFAISSMLNFWDVPMRYNVNTFWFIPTILSLLLKLDRGELGVSYARNTKIIGCVGTAPLNHSTKLAIEKKYEISLYESYGLSETLFVSTNSPDDNYENSAGQLLDDVKLTLSEDDEILINTPWMFLGYVNLEKNLYFKDGSYTSGDIGQIDQNNFLTITGRKKDLIIKGGINISPKRIENFIDEFGAFNEHTILGFDDQIMGEKIVCFFVLGTTSFNDDMKKKLNSAIISKLGKEYGIDQFVEIDEIPKNTNGKVDKPKIREIYKMINNDSGN